MDINLDGLRTICNERVKAVSKEKESVSAISRWCEVKVLRYHGYIGSYEFYAEKDEGSDIWNIFSRDSYDSDSRWDNLTMTNNAFMDVIEGD